MHDSSGLSDRQKLALTLALGVYFVASLTSMAVMSIGVGLLAAVWLATGAWRRTLTAPPARFYLVMASFLALACVASLISAWLWPMGFGGKFVVVNWAKDLGKLWYLFGALLVASCFTSIDTPSRRKLIFVIFSMTTLLGVISVIQYFTGWPRAQPIPSGSFNRFHASLFAGHHLSVASMIVFPMFMAFGVLVDPLARLHDRKLWRLAGLAALAALTVTFLTFARSTWVALPVGLAIWLVMMLPLKRAAAALAAGGGVLGVAWMFPEVSARLSDFAFSLGTRVHLWRINWFFFHGTPLVWCRTRKKSGAEWFLPILVSASPGSLCGTCPQ